MEKPGATIHSLDEGSLSVLIRQFEPIERVKQISLVCKHWRNIERGFPHQPKQLCLKPRDLDSIPTSWLLRDVSKLQELELLCDAELQSAPTGHWELVLGLLTDLSGRAYQLRSIAIETFDGSAPIAQCLSSISPLSRLECLGLRDWHFSKEEIPLLTQALSKLPNLKMLDLTGLVPSFGETLGAGGVKEYLQSAESLELRQAILGLRQLTSLHLRNVICLAAHSGLAVNFGSLANLRSLSVLWDSIPLYKLDSHLPGIAGITGLTQLEVIGWCDKEVEEEAAFYEALQGLEDLTYSNTAQLMHPRRLFSRATALTTLSLHCGLGREGRLGTILPVEVLHSVRDLTLDCYQFLLEEPVWPSEWSQLTQLTGLSFNFRHCPCDYHFPADFLATLGSLKRLHVTTNYENFSLSGEMGLLLVARSLKALEVLRVDVVDERRRGQPVLKRLNEICHDVCRKLGMLGVDGWQSPPLQAFCHQQATYFAPDKLPMGHLIFTRSKVAMD